jgi:LPS-assembly protein
MERRPIEHLLHFRGSVDLKYGESHVTADSLDLNTETGDGVAEGQVHFEDPQQQIQAERAEFNLFSRVGTLYQATGALKGVSPLHSPGAAPRPVTFYLAAERMVRETEERFRIQRGSLTTCVGPNPAWQFKARNSSVEVEGYARLSHATFWIKNVPVFYMPYLIYPTKRERATGLLFPTFGTSDRLGFFVEPRFFWAINEQSDATLGVDYLSKRGIRPNVEYRYALSKDDGGQFNGLYLSDDLTEQTFWKVSGTSRQTLPGQIRGLLHLDLVSRNDYDRTFELVDIFQRSRREADSYLSFSRNWDNAALGLQAQQLEDVENRADERLIRYPEVGFHYMPTLLPGLPLTLSMEALASNFRFDRAESLGGDLDARRFIFTPLMAWTYAQRPWVAVTPFVGLQETVFNQSGQGGETQSVALLGAEMRGPQLFRIFGPQGGARYKHLIEPSVTYNWIPHFSEKTRRDPFDIFDDVFPRNDVTIDLTNRLYARRPVGGGRLDSREIAFLRIGQGLDLTGQRGEEFTRIAPGPFFADLTMEARAQLTSTLSLRADAAYNYDEQRFDVADAGLFLQPLSFWSLSLERRFRRAPDIDFINGSTGLVLPKGWTLSYSTGFDAHNNVFAGNAVSALYRSQCWSLSLQMVQRPGETSFAFQVGLDSFLLPSIGF